ncbi:MAG TPA: hypothetical protein VIM38_10755, partial [Alphaproteobacteria bacterium]
MVLALVAQPAGAGLLPSPPGLTIDVESRPGVTLRYAALAPEGRARAALIMFIGGKGLATEYGLGRRAPETIAPLHRHSSQYGLDFERHAADRQSTNRVGTAHEDIQRADQSVR